jgi:hypothetical protein
MPATIEMRHLDVPAFSRVEVAAGLDVLILAGARQRISISAPDSETADRVLAEVHGDTLHLSFRHGLLGWLGGRQASVTVAALEIHGVKASAGSDVRLSARPTPQLELETASGSRLLAEQIDSERLLGASSSGSRLVLVGRCDIAELASSSGSSIDADRLHAAKIEVASSSGSRITADAEDGARVAASSGSRVNLRGRPGRFDQQTSSGGSVHIG